MEQYLKLKLRLFDFYFEAYELFGITDSHCLPRKISDWMLIQELLKTMASSKTAPTYFPQESK